ncbi:MAG TPA: multicopper oxidase family protein [Gemmatimonadota bacterium]|nr:multicopper oxidase family protein [Gemmatimonadota bacterium]
MRRPLLALAAAALAVAPAALAAVPVARASPAPAAAPIDSADPCPERTGAPSADLYCVTLLTTRAAPAATGAAWLVPAPSPFGLAVTADGRHVWELDIEIEGLPDPASLGPYGAYVLWVTTPLLDPVMRLGEVGNGRVRLGPVTFDKFLVLVSAEVSADVERRAGPLVLRGASAATRLQPHDLASVLAAATPAAGEGHTGHGETVGGWPAPPMHPAIPMLPGLERGLAPDADPWLPALDPAAVPWAVPTRALELSDGDSLHLVAAPVKRRLGRRDVVLYGFNGQIPGPLVRVDRGATITVGFENRTEWPTAVHWHGVRLENRFDGVPHVTQDPVPPGGTFRYEVRFPDAGLYWYHPHHREDVQQDMGLYGNLWVRPEDPDWLARVHREEVLVLDDLLLAEDGTPIPWGRETATHALGGRFGNQVLVNGEPDWLLEVDRGEVVRFWLTNVANTRAFNVSFGRPVKVVAGDVGLFEREEWVESVTISPAERYAVEARFDEPGEVAIVSRVRGVDHVYGGFVEIADTLGRIVVAERRAAPDLRAEFERLRENPAVRAEHAPFVAAAAGPPDHELRLTVEVGDLPYPVGILMRLDAVFFNPVEWFDTMPRMNMATTGRNVRWILRDAETGLENEAIRWRFRVGDRVKIRLVNERDAFHAMQHPIHVHGQRFLVLSVNGRPSGNLVWKDTAVVPAGGTAEILVEMSNPGRWMVHCHIAEHLETGMRTVFEVDP